MKKLLLSAMACVAISASAQVTIDQLCGTYTATSVTGYEAGVISGDYSQWTAIPADYCDYDVTISKNPAQENGVIVGGLLGFGIAEYVYGVVDFEKGTITFPPQSIDCGYIYIFCAQTDATSQPDDSLLEPATAKFSEADGKITVKFSNFTLYYNYIDYDDESQSYGAAYLSGMKETLERAGDIEAVDYTEVTGTYSGTTEGYEYAWVDQEAEDWADYDQTETVTVGVQADGTAKINGLGGGKINVNAYVNAAGYVCIPAQEVTVDGEPFTFCNETGVWNDEPDYSNQVIGYWTAEDGIYLPSWTAVYVDEEYDTVCFSEIETTLTRTGDYDGIAAVAADANAPAEYFNLQGMRVNASNLPAGIYIVRQGQQASKVLVK